MRIVDAQVHIWSAGKPTGGDSAVSGSCNPTSKRCGYRPVMNAQRVGVQTGAAAYALVNFIPCSASRSRTGVL